MKQIALIFSWVTAAMLLAGCAPKTDIVDVANYDYRDTKNLVRMVAEAARQIELNGLDTIADSQNWAYQTDEFYLYIYDMEDTCIYHGGMPELVNQHLSEITDIEGRSIPQLVHEALENPENPHGWIHYTWWAPGKFYPVPKSSCHFKTRLPDGRDVYVGGGIDHPHEEREFIRIVVDSAAKLIERQGAAALPIIADPLSSYNFRDVRSFVFRPDGNMMISPVLGDNRFDIDLRKCVDEAGNRPFDRAMQSLETQSTVWQIFIDHSRNERQPVKKTLYLRRTLMDQEPVYIGAITDLPHPP